MMGMEVRMRSLFAMILAMMVSFPAISSAQQDQATLRRVHVMTGAGTLPRNPANRLEYLRYATTGEPRLTGAQLIERIPEVQKFARVSVESDEFIPYDQPQELKALSLRMTGRLADPDIAGIIFTHGTNTIEETAYFMNLTVRSDKPVVIVGAQRPFSTLSSDGPLNLLNAIRVAADPGSRGKGTLVVLNDEINAARDVTKTNTYRLETFQSRELGILGYADPDKIVFYRAPTRKHTTQSQFDLTQTGELPKVSISTVTPATTAIWPRRRSPRAPRASSSPAPAPGTPRTQGKLSRSFMMPPAWSWCAAPGSAPAGWCGTTTGRSLASLPPTT